MSNPTFQTNNNASLTNPTTNNSNTVAAMTTSSHVVQKTGDNSYWDTSSNAYVSNDTVIGKPATCSGGN